MSKCYHIVEIAVAYWKIKRIAARDAAHFSLGSYIFLSPTRPPVLQSLTQDDVCWNTMNFISLHTRDCYFCFFHLTSNILCLV